MPPGQSIRWDPERDELWAVIAADGEAGVQGRSVELARDETSITWGVDTGRLDCEYEVTVRRQPRVTFDFVRQGESASNAWLELVEVSAASATTVGFDIVEEARAGFEGSGVQLDDDLGTFYNPATTHDGAEYGVVFRPRPPAAASELRISLVQGERVLARWVADLHSSRPVGPGREAES